MTEQPTITQADRDAAEQWRFIECMHCSEYEGDFVNDLAADFAHHRTTSLAAHEALAGYRAAVSFISADSWDGCSDCINILKAARCADMTDAMTIDETAEHLKRIRLHYDPAALPAAPSLAAQDGLVEAARKAVVAYAFHECQPDKGHIFSWLDDRAQEIAQAALSAIKEQHHD